MDINPLQAGRHTLKKMQNQSGRCVPPQPTKLEAGDKRTEPNEGETKRDTKVQTATEDGRKTGKKVWEQQKFRERPTPRRTHLDCIEDANHMISSFFMLFPLLQLLL